LIFWGGIFGILWAFFLFTGWFGIDFGLHWDEDKLVQGLRWSLDHHTILPGDYLYPSLAHTIGLASLAWDSTHYFFLSPSFSAEGIDYLKQTVGSHSFLIRMRLLSVVSASFSLLGVFLAVRRLGRPAWEGILAASFLGLSWEVSYHSRWWTVDPLLLCMSALTLFLLCGAQSSRRAIPWILAAALGAGLGAGSKQTGLFLFASIGCFIALSPDLGPARTRLKWISVSAGVGGIAFLLTTPGILMDFRAFWQDFLFQVHVYGVDGMKAHTVERGWEHFLLMVTYLGTVMFSRHIFIAFPLFALAIMGGAEVVRKEPRLGLSLLVFPALLLAFFSTQILMIARNLIPLAPFLAFWAARGTATLMKHIKKWRGANAAFLTLLMSALAANAFWTAWAAWTIRARDRINQGYWVARYIEEHAGRFFLTPAVARAVPLLSKDARARITTDPRSPSDFAIFNTFEAGKRFDGFWPANRRGYAQAWFGSFEVNLDYYPLWLGNHRFVVMETAKALKTLGPPRNPQPDRVAPGDAPPNIVR
jgi:hypothetical protein